MPVKYLVPSDRAFFHGKYWPMGVPHQLKLTESHKLIVLDSLFDEKIRPFCSEWEFDWIIETNIDDMNPQFYEHIMDLLFQNGAKDVFITSILMKKNRPGNILTVICDPSDESRLTDIIFRETTTLGVRISVKEKRTILKREIITLKTPWGDARAKIRYIDKNRISASPEYEDCKRIARDKNLPLNFIYETVKTAADNFIKNNFS